MELLFIGFGSSGLTTLTLEVLVGTEMSEPVATAPVTDSLAVFSVEFMS